MNLNCIYPFINMFNCYTCTKTQMFCTILECKNSVKIIAALTSFRNEPSIIKNADKSYCRESEPRQLYSRRTKTFKDSIHFAKIHKDKTQYIQSLVVNEMHINSDIDKITYRYLSQPLKFPSGRFYLLPKIHKIGVMDIKKFRGREDLQREMLVPERPIISRCSSPIMLI